MSVETIERAIKRLEDLRERAFPLPYEAYSPGVRSGDHWHLLNNNESVAHISANDGWDEPLRQPTADLLAALSRTVDPLIEHLREFAWLYCYGNSPGERVMDSAAALARSILGEES